MSNITANLVKELREKTGVGMMDCKKALTETNGDFEAAVDWLRKKGYASAAKRSGKTAAEGMVAVSIAGNKGVCIELNSETDFVARNDKFQALINNILKVAINSTSIEQLKESKYPGTDKSIQDEIIENVAVIGENINLRRFGIVTVKEGVVASYVHNAIIPNAGKIAVMVGLESTADKEKLSALGKQIAMHIAAAKPEVLDISEVKADDLEREKQIFIDQARASGKPDNIIEKMVGGRVSKYYQEVVLLEQISILDNKTKISELLANFAKETGAQTSISGFVRFELGDGVVKTEDE